MWILQKNCLLVGICLEGFCWGFFFVFFLGGWRGGGSNHSTTMCNHVSPPQHGCHNVPIFFYEWKMMSLLALSGDVFSFFFFWGFLFVFSKGNTFSFDIALFMRELCVWNKWRRSPLVQPLEGLQAENHLSPENLSFVLWLFASLCKDLHYAHVT